MIAEPPVEEFVRYDPAIPIAVFLGPSLDRRRAEEILSANYYPPVRMGDVYRLIGSGVQLIVIIDGIFHRHAPVWQREILDALYHGITVIGASSMGALRAAELHSFGMIGHGTIFEWYRDGVIDGDDEVALNHGDASSGFRALSEPLVNIRASLAEAVRAGHCTADEAAELIAPAKLACYVERSWHSLLRDLPAPRRSSLQRFVETSAVNLKERDALNALRFAASLRDELPPPAARAVESRTSFYRGEAALRRGFLHSAGYLFSGRRVLTEALKNPEPIAALQPDLARRHFLLLWAHENKIRCPDDYAQDFRERRGPYTGSLPALGLTPAEHDRALAEDALLDWMFARGPEHFGLRFDRHRRYVAALLPVLAGADAAAREPEFLRKAAETCFLASWARQNGFALPAETVAAFLRDWETVSGIADRGEWLQRIGLSEEDYLAISVERALYHTLGQLGPGWFGCESWSPDRALLSHFQRTGSAADLVAQLSPPAFA
jgi:hypothetical protein